MSETETTETDETAICPECGNPHPELSMLPDRPITFDELRELEDGEKIIYAGPTAISVTQNGPDLCRTIVLGTEETVSVAAYYDSIGWIRSFTDDDTFRDDDTEVDTEYALLINEMASQSVEAGYSCVQHWLDIGEPGGNCPI